MSRLPFLRLRGWLWLLLLLLLALGSLWRVRSSGRPAVQTDLLAMLPETENHPLAEAALRRLAEASGERAILLVGHREEALAKAATLEMAERLERSGAFTHVLGRVPPLDPTQLTRFYAPYRFGLPGGDPAAGPLDLIQARLAGFRGSIGGLDPAQDPEGRLEAFLGQLPLSDLRLQRSDDLLVIRTESACYGLVVATLRGSAFDPEVQTRSLGALRAAEREVRSGYVDLDLLHTGAVFYAEEARSGAEREMGLISTVSGVVLGILYLLIFRSLRQPLLGAACVGAGMALATSVCLLLYGQVYLLTLVSGASLLGVAVDYSFHYFAHHRLSHATWDADAVLRHIRPSLVIGFLTTILAYAALILTPFPGLRQVAVFTVLALGGALLTVFFWVPDFLHKPAKPFPALHRALDRWQSAMVRWAGRPRLGWVALGTALLLGLGALGLKSRDDASALIQTSPKLRAEEARIRHLTGLALGGTFYLVEGRDEAEVLAREEVLRARLEPLLASRELEAVQAVSAFVPSPEVQLRERTRRREAFPDLEQALRKLDFRPEAVRRLRSEFKATEGRLIRVQDWLQQPFATPYRQLWLGQTEGGCASVVVPSGARENQRMVEVVRGLSGVRYVDKTASVGRLLGHHRRVALIALAAACLLVWGSLAFRYGPKGAFWVTLPALFGILLPLSVMALWGIPLTLFGVLGLIVTLGFAVDYTVFLREGDLHDSASLLGVLLDGASTLASYGPLVLSLTPFLQGFGLVITLGVVGSLPTAFLALRGRIAKA